MIKKYIILLLGMIILISYLDDNFESDTAISKNIITRRVRVSERSNLKSIHPDNLILVDRREGKELLYVTLQGGAKLRTRLNEDDVISVRESRIRQEYIVREKDGTSKLELIHRGILRRAFRSWVYSDTSLEFIEKHFFGDIGGMVDQIREIRKRWGPNQPIVVVDWGCGDGTALCQLARELQMAGIQNILLFGFADMPFPEWNKAPSEVTFILDTVTNMHLYFSKGEIDLIYSFSGLDRLHEDLIVEQFAEFLLLLDREGVVFTSDYSIPRLAKGFLPSVQLKLKALGFVIQPEKEGVSLTVAEGGRANEGKETLAQASSKEGVADSFTMFKAHTNPPEKKAIATTILNALDQLNQLTALGRPIRVLAIGPGDLEILEEVQLHLPTGPKIDCVEPDDRFREKIESRASDGYNLLEDGYVETVQLSETYDLVIESHIFTYIDPRESTCCR